MLSEGNNTTTAELLVQLNPKMQRFIHLYNTGQYTLTKLAQLLDVNVNTIYGWMKRDDVKQVIGEMQLATHDVVSTQLKSLTLKAVNRLSELTQSPIDGVALQAVKDILDRAGHRSEQKIKIDKTVTTFEQRLSSLIDKTIPDVDNEIIDAEVIE
jgi:transposase-like protein